MNRQLNREILRLSIPSILANITVPLVGMADTAIAGHLDGPSATYIGAVSVGSIFFTLLYWSFGFLRTGTGGLTARAYGAQNYSDCAGNLMRGLFLAMAIALVALILQTPFLNIVNLLNDSSPEVRELASRYFYIRVWAAPATLSLMVFRGWFVGMQDSMSSMWADLIINLGNILFSIVLTFGIGNWDGLGFDGIALGTLIAQYCGLCYCFVRAVSKYGDVLRGSRVCVSRIFADEALPEFFKMNANLLARSFFFIAIYYGNTMIAASYGDLYLSCNSIMMQLLMLFSYFTDGFAYAGEALTGRFIGARQVKEMRTSVKYTFVWSLSLTGVFIVFYVFAGVPLLKMMTSDALVVQTCTQFLPWLVLMPPLGCAAFTWDGIFLGASSAKSLRNAMGGAAIAFFALWFVAKAVLKAEGAQAMHLLFAAYFAHLAFRTVYLSIVYKKNVILANFSATESGLR